MVRTTVMADERTLERLRALARDRRVSFAEIVREALDQKAAEYRPRPSCLGIGDSGRTDISSTVATERIPPRSWR